VIANNLANMNTTGFKEQRAEFEDLLYQNISQPGANSSDTGTLLPSGIQLGAGVRTAAVYRVTTQGDFKQTDNPLDMAVNGPGFFRVQQPDGTDAFTRAGNFGLSPEGQIVTDQGYTVSPGIAIPANALSIAVNAQGQVSATVAGQTAPQILGTLELTRFANEAGLRAIGNNLYLETPASGSPQAGVPGSAGYGTLQQKFLETSNVNAVEEITSLITAQRAYEMNSKVVTAADQMLQAASHLGA
jgi:flagellar basal-body rod protein FlgG